MIYVLFYNYVDVDSGEFITSVIGVFYEFEQAQKMMVDTIKKMRKDFENYDTKEEEYVDGDMTWSICEKEDYPSHHCDIIIEAHQIL